jgi:hypothetical protein
MEEDEQRPPAAAAGHDEDFVQLAAHQVAAQREALDLRTPRAPGAAREVTDDDEDDAGECGRDEGAPLAAARARRLRDGSDVERDAHGPRVPQPD